MAKDTQHRMRDPLSEALRLPVVRRAILRDASGEPVGVVQMRDGGGTLFKLIRRLKTPTANLAAKARE